MEWAMAHLWKLNENDMKNVRIYIVRLKAKKFI